MVPIWECDLLMGIILGVFSCYYLFDRDLNQVNDRLDCHPAADRPTGSGTGGQAGGRSLNQSTSWQPCRGRAQRTVTLFGGKSKRHACPTNPQPRRRGEIEAADNNGLESLAAILRNLVL